MIPELEQIVRFATMAPSGHNTQPWRFSSEENRIYISPDYARRLLVVDPDDHALFISLGCALENLVLAAEHFGYGANISYLFEEKEPGKIVVELTARHDSPDNELFNAIPQRQSTRRMFDGRPILQQDLELLRTVPLEEGISAKVFVQKSEIEPLIDFAKEGNRLQFGNRDFVNELTRWIRFSRSEAEQLGDGLSSAVMGAPSIPQWLGRLIMRFTSGEKEAKKCAKAIRSSSALMLFISGSNNIPSWIRLGRSFERIVLKATALGIRHAHINMPCEELAVRRKLQEHLGLNTEQPLLLVRLGYGEPMPKSLRRPLQDVLTSE